LASVRTIIVHNTATDDTPKPIKQKYSLSVVSAKRLSLSCSLAIGISPENERLADRLQAGMNGQ
jgi:hypothetical protein